MTEEQHDMAELQQALCALIDDEISLDPSVPVAGDTDLLLTGLVDSLGVVQIVEWLEDRTGVDIDPGDVILEHFQTVDLMVAFVNTLVPAERAAPTSAAPKAP